VLDLATTWLTAKEWKKKEIQRENTHRKATF
jgi:hypothetical protein